MKFFKNLTLISYINGELIFQLQKLMKINFSCKKFKNKISPDRYVIIILEAAQNYFLRADK